MHLSQLLEGNLRERVSALTCGARVMWNSRVSIATAVGTLILASCCPRQFLHIESAIRTVLTPEPDASCTGDAAQRGQLSTTVAHGQIHVTSARLEGFHHS